MLGNYNWIVLYSAVDHLSTTESLYPGLHLLQCMIDVSTYGEPLYMSILDVPSSGDTNDMLQLSPVCNYLW